METTTFIKKTMKDLEDMISAEGETVKFPRQVTEESGQRFLKACAQNDEDERKRRAEIMRDASRIVIF